MEVFQSLDISLITYSGRILASALALAKTLIKIESTPLYIDRKITEFILSYNAVPSFIGLGEYPYATCISVNDQVVHAVPTRKPLKRGDVVTVDIGVSYKGHCTDAARTFVVGKKSREKKNLIDAVNIALDDGIKAAVAGNRIGDISYAIQRAVELNGYRSPLEFGGHGIGTKPHLDPFISNTGMKGLGVKLLEGICLAIEPIAMAGSIEVFVDEADTFTCYSEDGCLSAHAEDTIIVTKTVPIILTRATFSGGNI